MLITRTFLDKSNTIIKGNPANTGTNPTLQLFYGNMTSRAIVHFDHTKVKQLVEDKTYPDTSKLTHTLKIWNCSDINLPIIDKCMSVPNQLDTFCRATSYDLVFFRIPKSWDQGRGFDCEEDHRPEYKRAYSEFGSNWYDATTDTKWDKPGIYTSDEIAQFIEDNSDIIIGTQHFDFGNENIELDITEYFNKLIDETYENNGIGIAFTPSLEEMKTNNSQYAGFFSSETHTFFEPYIETVYNETIEDDRTNFYIGKENKLYFYANVGGNNVNLDQLPTCTINGDIYPTKQATKGVYYITIPSSVTTAMQDKTMYYDEWSNIIYQGQAYPDVELQFTTKSSKRYFGFGLPYESEKRPKFTPLVYGIKNDEKITQGDVRKLHVDCKVNYTVDQIYAVDNLEYRLYTKVENKDITIVNWFKVDREYNDNSFLVNTKELVPQTYYIDIKAKYNEEEIVTRQALKFTLVSEYENN